MKNITDAELEKNLKSVLDMVAKGEEIIISANGGEKKVAALIPFDHYEGRKKRRLGKLAGIATYKIMPDFKMTDDEFLAS